jgi:hypothetical protein|tara:strand:+ start:255 stop:776 length:522 start_codon:yes stop_codon:yes gene_type:complete
MNLNNLVQAAIFAAMAIGLGFMFLLVPNLEFISVTVFLAGFTLGIGYGGMVGGTAILIYSVMNPLGSGLIYLTLLAGQILAMAGIGIVGSFSKRLLKNETSFYRIGMAGGLGFLCTLWYDGITTLAYPISAGYTWDEAMAYAISGLLFTFMHLISNTVIFSVVVPGYLNRLSQ